MEYVTGRDFDPTRGFRSGVPARHPQLWRHLQDAEGHLECVAKRILHTSGTSGAVPRVANTTAARLLGIIDPIGRVIRTDLITHQPFDMAIACQKVGSAVVTAGHLT